MTAALLKRSGNLTANAFEEKDDEGGEYLCVSVVPVQHSGIAF